MLNDITAIGCGACVGRRRGRWRLCGCLAAWRRRLTTRNQATAAIDTADAASRRRRLSRAIDRTHAGGHYTTRRTQHGRLRRRGATDAVRTADRGVRGDRDRDGRVGRRRRRPRAFVAVGRRVHRGARRSAVRAVADVRLARLQRRREPRRGDRPGARLRPRQRRARRADHGAVRLPRRLGDQAVHRPEHPAPGAGRSTVDRRRRAPSPARMVGPAGRDDPAPARRTPGACATCSC